MKKDTANSMSSEQPETVMTEADRRMMESLAMGYNQQTAEVSPELKTEVIPLPRRVVQLQQSVTLNGRVVCTAEELKAKAEFFIVELKCFAQLDFILSPGPARPGDLVLELDDSVRGYRLCVDGTSAVLSAGSPDDFSRGTSTVLQLLTPGQPQLAGMLIEDWPDSEFRGVMVDLGRRPHTRETLKRLILLAKFYKMNYLHLHLSDTELYSFASEHFPELNTEGATLSRTDWMELEEFSRLCGVVLLPELDFPGHAQFFLSKLPQLRCSPPHHNTVCLGREETYKIIATLLDEICSVFRSSPYCHIGADEAEADGWRQCSFCREEMQRNHWDNPEELYRNFIVRMNELVKSHGKRTIVWEGFGPDGQVKIPRDVVVMVFESLYHLPGDLVAAGYDVINTSWQPLYLEGTQINWPTCHIFNWNKYRWENWFEKSAAFPGGLEVAATPQVLGAGLCSWGVQDADEVGLLHSRMAVLTERLWNPESRNFRDWQRRWGNMQERVVEQYLKISDKDIKSLTGGEIF